MKESSMLLSDIALFVEVARTGSFSRAAARLEMPVPTLSRRIAAMEKRLGVQLLQRTTRKVSLAQVARPYYERCVEAVTAAEAAQAAIEDSRAMQECMRISMPVDLGVEIIGPIISRFLTEHPALRVEFDLSSTASDLFRDPVDLAFRIGKAMDDRVVARKIASISSGLYASPAYVERAGHITSPAQLAQAQCLNVQTAQGPMPWVVGTHRWKGAPGSCTISANSMALLRTLAEEGHGVALLPRHLVRGSLQASKLVPVLEAEKTISWPLYAITASRLIAKGLRLLIAHVKNELQTSHSEVL